MAERIGACAYGPRTRVMRLLTGAGTPRELAARAAAWLGVVLTPEDGLIAVLLVAVEDQAAICVVSIQSDPFD